MVIERAADGQAPSDVDCPEDCPRCNRCLPDAPRRMKIVALITETELEKQRTEASVGLQSLLPPMDWHALVQQALAK